ncbi:MAG: UDP-N-acetylmuramate:L-alanyl-gamma-D-glutamyl-meso-diaminopimelate ligase, partial [Spirochaetota bacterium]
LQQAFWLRSCLMALQAAGKKIHFIGIGGTAMAGAAQMAVELGFSVRGSDQNLYPPTSTELQASGIPYTEGYRAENLAYGPDLVVLGNAISRGNAELEYALSERLELISLPQFVAEYVIRGRRSLVVAGTHGKTTTTSLAAYILRQAGLDAGYMIGGVAPDFVRSASVGTADLFVIEGDEYDTSIFDQRSKFLSYRPTHVILNNIEFDHGDIFADLQAVERTFARLIKIIPANGILVTNADNPSCMQLAKHSFAPVVTFGTAAAADYQLLEIITGNSSIIRSRIRGESVEFESPLFGRHNAMNALACLALLESVGIDRKHFVTAIRSFQGVKRRLELRLESPQVTVIEDFAHHPTAIAANLQTLREIYAGRRLVVLVEPRSNTMVRNVFQGELTEALAQADVIFLDQIYRPEKYRPEERLDTQLLVSTLRARGRSAYLLPAESRVEAIRDRLLPGDVVCFMTNGSFGGLIGALVNALAQTYQKKTQ